MENQTKNEHLSDCDSDEDSDEYIYEEDILLKDNYNRQQSSDTIERKKCSEKFSSKSGGKDEKSNDSDNKKSSKIRTKKLKRFSESKTAFDGRKVIFTTEFTQTDWSWKDNAELSGQATIIASRNGKSNSRQTSGKTHSEGESTHEDRTVTDLSPFSLQPNDEFGIPLTDVSTDSDSDCTDIETPKKMKPLKSYPPLVGPPLILKYIGESELPGTEENPSLSNHDGEADLPVNQVGDFDEYGNAVGMFSGVCEFCGTNIKPFPSLEQQLSEPPEVLYCCEDYRDFVEFAMTTANRLETDVAKRSQKISVNVHGHYGSQEDRLLAKEKAVQRMHERELQRRRQEASGLHTSYQNAYMYQEEDSDNLGYTQAAETKKPSKKETAGTKGGGGDKGNGVGEKPLKGGGGSFDVESTGGHSIHRHAPALHPTAGGPLGGFGALNNEAPQNAGQGSFDDVSRQMKTINYQLSSQRCLEEGWTLRVPSPLNLDDPDTEIFVPEPFHPMALVSGQVQGREIIQKFYPNGTPFLIIFPDGTGNVFYPSGRIAILITSVTLGQNTYVVLDDSTESQILAVFDATGCGTCYFMDGKIRLNYDQQGGIELDLTGSRRRSWIWKDHETHVHAPPFQPIVFGMNYFLSVRVMSQENIALSLTGKKRSCRFNVGTKLKMVMPENYLDKFNEYQLYIDEHKLQIQSLMIKVNNLLKFPKSPKLDSMLPPVSLTSKQFKVNQKRQQLNSLSPRNKEKRITKQHRLPPLDQTSVIVN